MKATEVLGLIVMGTGLISLSGCFEDSLGRCMREDIQVCHSHSMENPTEEDYLEFEMGCRSIDGVYSTNSCLTENVVHDCTFKRDRGTLFFAIYSTESIEDPVSECGSESIVNRFTGPASAP